MEQSVHAARVAALAEAWAVWATVGAGLSDGQWAAPTRCEGWTVADLFAHHSAFPLGFAAAPPAPDDPASRPHLTAVDIVRGFNRPGGGAHRMAGAVADRAAAEARRVSRAELLERFAVSGPAAAANLRSADPGSLVRWPGTGGLIRLVDALRIVVMEATVHLLDVLRALGVEPAVPEAALRETAVFLAEVADPVALIEAATGRSESSPLPVLR